MSIQIRILKISIFLLSTFVRPIVLLGYKLFYLKLNKRNPLPKIKNSLLLLPANVLAKKIRKHEIKSSELVIAYIERVRQIQPYLNCVVFDCFDEALEEAKNVDKLLESEDLPEKYNEQNAPLLGVPFSCKESIWCKGKPNDTGLISRKDFRAPEDADVVRNMRGAGAILLCLTNTPELCMWIETSNRVHGLTRNPYNLSRIVGGSSGGEGALIGGAGSVMGLASDIGGSIRMPSFFNGVYGHKASPFAISNKTHYPPVEGMKERMLAIGPICRFASDLSLLFKINAGAEYKEFETKFNTNIEFRKVNFFVISEFDAIVNSKLSKSCAQALQKAVDNVEKSFDVKVKKLNLPKLKNSLYIWASMMNNGHTSSTAFGDLLVESAKHKINAYLEILKAIFNKSNYTIPLLLYTITEQIPIPNPERFIEFGNELREEFGDILGENGILLFPSFPVVAPYHNQPLITNYCDFIHFGIFNALGLPVTQCPMGLCPKTGLPTGVQVVSNFKCDHLTIKLAQHFEQNLVGWIPPC